MPWLLPLPEQRRIMLLTTLDKWLLVFHEEVPTSSNLALGLRNYRKSKYIIFMFFKINLAQKRLRKRMIYCVRSNCIAACSGSAFGASVIRLASAPAASSALRQPACPS